MKFIGFVLICGLGLFVFAPIIPVSAQRHATEKIASEQPTDKGENYGVDWFDPAFALPVSPQPHLLTTLWGRVKVGEEKKDN